MDRSALGTNDRNMEEDGCLNFSDTVAVVVRGQYGIYIRKVCQLAVELLSVPGTS